MSKQYDCLPSVIIGIDDSYTAFCFNEACTYIKINLDKGETPIYPVETEKKEYSNFKDFYKQYK